MKNKGLLALALGATAITSGFAGYLLGNNGDSSYSSEQDYKEGSSDAGVVSKKEFLSIVKERDTLRYQVSSRRVDKNLEGLKDYVPIKSLIDSKFGGLVDKIKDMGGVGFDNDSGTLYVHNYDDSFSSITPGNDIIGRIVTMDKTPSSTWRMASSSNTFSSNDGHHYKTFAFSNPLAFSLLTTIDSDSGRVVGHCTVPGRILDYSMVSAKNNEGKSVCLLGILHGDCLSTSFDSEVQKGIFRDFPNFVPKADPVLKNNGSLAFTVYRALGDGLSSGPANPFTKINSKMGVLSDGEKSLFDETYQRTSVFVAGKFFNGASKQLKYGSSMQLSPVAFSGSLGRLDVSGDSFSFHVSLEDLSKVDSKYLDYAHRAGLDSSWSVRTDGSLDISKVLVGEDYPTFEDVLNK